VECVVVWLGILSTIAVFKFARGVCCGGVGYSVN
jgi:hypothetical protein